MIQLIDRKYILIILLLIFPHKNYAQKEKSLCVAHRGNASEFFENSLESLASAEKLGADAIEFDIQTTADGVPIIMHDKTLKRVSESSPKGKCPLETAISKLDSQLIFANCRLKNGRPIPLFEQALELLSDKNSLVFIELKAKANQAVMDLIEKYYQLQPQKVRIISFKKKYYKKIKQAAKHSLFWKKIKILKISYSVPHLLGNNGINVHYFSMANTLLPNILGRETGIWTVNDLHHMKKAIKLGVNFITTDNPKLCLQATSKF